MKMGPVLAPLLSVKVIRMPESLLRPALSESERLLASAFLIGMMALSAGISNPRNKA